MSLHTSNYFDRRSASPLMIATFPRVAVHIYISFASTGWPVRATVPCTRENIDSAAVSCSLARLSARSDPPPLGLTCCALEVTLLHYNLHSRVLPRGHAQVTDSRMPLLTVWYFPIYRIYQRDARSWFSQAAAQPAATALTLSCTREKSRLLTSLFARRKIYWKIVAISFHIVISR